MEQHEKGQKIKRIVRVFIYFLLILFFVIILAIVLRWEKRSNQTQDNKTTELVISKDSS